MKRLEKIGEFTSVLFVKNFINNIYPKFSTSYPHVVSAQTFAFIHLSHYTTATTISNNI